MLNFSGLRYDLRAGWNLVSLPLETSNDSSANLFPGTQTGPFLWNGSYNGTSILAPGSAYWVKYPADKTINMFGDSIVTDTVALQ